VNVGSFYEIVNFFCVCVFYLSTKSLTYFVCGFCSSIPSIDFKYQFYVDCKSSLRWYNGIRVSTLWS